MKKLTVFVLLSAMLVSAISLFAGKVEAAALFGVRVTCGESWTITSQRLDSDCVWWPEDTKSLVTLTLKDGKKTDGIYVAWMTDDGKFLIRAKDADGEVVKEYRPGDQFDGFGNFYPLPTSTKTVEISFTKLTEKCGIGYVQMEEAGIEDPTIMRWNPPREGGVDLLIVPTHQDDEHIFLGGVAPYFLDLGYSVSVAYSVRCSRLRYEEALRGLWALGFVDYPDFLGYKDGRKDTYKEMIDFWGGDEKAILKSFVRLIRKDKPQVIVSHDEVGGETNHQQHIATAKLLAEAFVKAADPDFDTDSVETYGTWQAKKYYEHVWKENVVQLDFTKKLKKYGGLNALEAAAVGYEYHVSQHHSYDVFKGSSNDTSLYGLRLSSVGYDDIDMFYNVKGTDFTKTAVTDNGARVWVSVPEVSLSLKNGAIRMTPTGKSNPPVATTKQVTTKQVTTKQVTTKQVTTKPVTTKPVTTEAPTTQVVTTEIPTTETPTTIPVTTALPTTELVTTAVPTTIPITTATPTQRETTTAVTQRETTAFVTAAPESGVTPNEKSENKAAKIAVIALCAALLSAQITIPFALRKKKSKNNKE